MKYFLFFLMLTSCISDENLRLQSNSMFQGGYVGSFNGDLSGEIIFEVLKTGSLEGKIYYTTNSSDNSSEEILGYVAINGKFDASTKSGLCFSGYLNHTSMNGKWYKGHYLKGNFIIYYKK